MKLPSKPISSPGRAEKYPPPLMRFLRSNVGSRSRGRSRSSPMFVRKKSTAAAAAAAAIETQEPSSPKVTCMGQVRVKRSTRSGKSKRRCKWIEKALFCRHFAGKLRPRCSKPDLRKWVMFFHCGFKRKSKIREDSSKIEPKFSTRSQDSGEDVAGEEDIEETSITKHYFSTAVSPPRNALILTRSRSAPYRSSSLAGRFWGSPESQETEQKQSTEMKNRFWGSPGNQETEQKQSTEVKNSSDNFWRSPENQETEQKQSIELTISSDDEIRSPENENLCEKSDQEVKLNAESVNSSKIEEEIEIGSVNRLILTRCKSEPARIAEKLDDPELSFWKKRRLGFT
ncbi:protamine P1 family protein [Euphorbia peplus]|nr:protamine P1 family protein [Euphorbia peplus]